MGAQKLDPYINVDPGTMSPFQHGEVFVTEDGAETDLDLGHYERFMDENLNKYSNLTTGRVYWDVLTKEREGAYLGETIQVIPHITGEIKRFIYSGARAAGADVLITEIGGTIGDIESQPFLEAIRQIFLETGRGDCILIHVTLVPYIEGSEELKSKPTQHSVRELQSMGLRPGIIVARCDRHVPDALRQKIAMFCNVKPDCVIENVTLPSLYEAPLMLHSGGLDGVVCRELMLDAPPPRLNEWEAMVERSKTRERHVRIALVGKYVQLRDAYLSVAEALSHAGYALGTEVGIQWVDSGTLNSENAGTVLGGAGGILIPGGFGDRGIEGKIAACKYARENNVPFLGICLGMQVAVIEFARNVCGLSGANSSEFDPSSKDPVIGLMEAQHGVRGKGGTMRLGAYPCSIRQGTALERLYSNGMVYERHRHRYEFNNVYRKMFLEKGLVFSGMSPDGALVEAIELPPARFFVGVQFHPEFKSRPNKPHPLFIGLVESAAAV